MKQCSKCNCNLPESEFYKKSNSRLRSDCKSCFNSYCIERWKARKIKAMNLNGNRCLDCKQEYHYSIYEFHHLDPSQKDMNWSKMRLVSDKKFKAELEKCVMLCANCHRLRHYNKGTD